VRCERGGAPGQDVAGGGAWEGGGEAGRAGLKTGINTNKHTYLRGWPFANAANSYPCRYVPKIRLLGQTVYK